MVTFKFSYRDIAPCCMDIKRSLLSFDLLIVLTTCGLQTAWLRCILLLCHVFVCLKASHCSLRYQALGCSHLHMLPLYTVHIASMNFYGVEAHSEVGAVEVNPHAAARVTMQGDHAGIVL